MERITWEIYASGGEYYGDIFSLFVGTEEELEEQIDNLDKKYGDFMEFSYMESED